MTSRLGSSMEESSRKKTRYNNDVAESTTLVHLSQDELSHILNFLPISSKLMLACLSRSMFQVIDTLTREKLYAYDKSIPLSQLWLKYNQYQLQLEEIESVKILLERAGSFSGITQKLLINIDIYEQEKLKEVCKQLKDLFSIPTGGNTTVQIIENSNVPVKTITIPETMGHTVKHIQYTQNPEFDFKMLNYFCKVESLTIESDDLGDGTVVPEFQNSHILSNLKQLIINCLVSNDVNSYFAKLMPNLEVLRISEVLQEFPKKFVECCPNLKEMYFSTIEDHTNITDQDVLFMLQYLPELRKLDIVTMADSFSGSAFNQIGKYAKKLEYLHICREEADDNEVYENAEFGGGELPSLKQFIFCGQLEIDGGNYNIPRLFESVIENCHNIKQIRIEDNNNEDYPCNLYGLVPIQNVADLLLYPKDDCLHEKFKIPGIHAMNIIVNMSDGWKDIAQSEFVKVVTMYELPPIDALKRCRWNNAHTLAIYSWNEEHNNIEYFKCLTEACPNIKYFNDRSRERDMPQGFPQVLCNNTIWPNLIDCNLAIPSDLIDIVSKNRPNIHGTQWKHWNTPNWTVEWLSGYGYSAPDAAFTRWLV
jgi:Leucine-rich repeat (LRR) protein